MSVPPAQSSVVSAGVAPRNPGSCSSTFAHTLLDSDTDSRFAKESTAMCSSALGTISVHSPENPGTARPPCPTQPNAHTLSRDESFSGSATTGTDMATDFLREPAYKEFIPIIPWLLGRLWVWIGSRRSYDTMRTESTIQERALVPQDPSAFMQTTSTRVSAVLEASPDVHSGVPESSYLPLTLTVSAQAPELVIKCLNLLLSKLRPDEDTQAGVRLHAVDAAAARGRLAARSAIGFLLSEKEGYVQSKGALPSPIFLKQVIIAALLDPAILDDIYDHAKFCIRPQPAGYSSGELLCALWGLACFLDESKVKARRLVMFAFRNKARDLWGKLVHVAQVFDMDQTDFQGPDSCASLRITVVKTKGTAWYVFRYSGGRTLRICSLPVSNTTVLESTQDNHGLARPT